MKEQQQSLASVIRKNEADLLAEWGKEQSARQTRRDKVHEAEAGRLSKEFLSGLVAASAQGTTDARSGAFSKVREILGEFSSARATQGYSPTETAMFVFSLKKPLFARLRKELASDPQALADALWNATAMLDELGLYTTEMYQKVREDVIARQQRELLELSTPVVELWEGVLALPLIGTLDSGRTQVVMESLLE